MTCDRLVIFTRMKTQRAKWQGTGAPPPTTQATTTTATSRRADWPACHRGPSGRDNDERRQLRTTWLAWSVRALAAATETGPGRDRRRGRRDCCRRASVLPAPPVTEDAVGASNAGERPRSRCGNTDVPRQWLATRLARLLPASVLVPGPCGWRRHRGGVGDPDAFSPGESLPASIGAPAMTDDAVGPTAAGERPSSPNICRVKGQGPWLFVGREGEQAGRWQ